MSTYRPKPTAQVAVEVAMDPLQPQHDLLYGSPDAPPDAPSATPAGAPGRLVGPDVQGRGSGRSFADSAPGVDDHGRPVPCDSCGTALSQPRIDYGLTACPNCRMSTQPTSAGRA